jgi:hypothetical protein
MGGPGKGVKELGPEAEEENRRGAANYVGYTKGYRRGEG